jgi:hypothetical protein
MPNGEAPWEGWVQPSVVVRMMHAGLVMLEEQQEGLAWMMPARDVLWWEVFEVASVVPSHSPARPAKSTMLSSHRGLALCNKPPSRRYHLLIICEYVYS